MNPHSEKGMSVSARLGLSLGLTVVLLIAEVIGGLLSNSLALLSDAGHVFTDSLALILSFTASRIARWPSGEKATFGYGRVALLAAVINGLSLIAISGFIFWESYSRLVAPQDVNLGVMMPFALLGLAGNIIMAAVLFGGKKDLNLRSAWLHVLGDTLSSVGVIISAVVIYFTGWQYADPLAGIIIGSIIVTGGARVLMESLRVLLELPPAGYSVEKLVAEIAGVPGVLGVHAVHLWSVTHGMPAFSAHVVVNDQQLSSAEKIRDQINHRLSHMGIEHTAIDLESAECHRNELYCELCGNEQTGTHHGGHGH